MPELYVSHSIFDWRGVDTEDRSYMREANSFCNGPRAC